MSLDLPIFLQAPHVDCRGGEKSGNRPRAACFGYTSLSPSSASTGLLSSGFFSKSPEAVSHVLCCLLMCCLSGCSAEAQHDFSILLTTEMPAIASPWRSELTTALHVLSAAKIASYFSKRRRILENRPWRVPKTGGDLSPDSY